MHPVTQKKLAHRCGLVAKTARTGTSPGFLIQKEAKYDFGKHEGWSALMFACHYNQSETAKLLIQKGANLGLVNKEGATYAKTVCKQTVAIFICCSSYSCSAFYRPMMKPSSSIRI